MGLLHLDGLRAIREPPAVSVLMNSSKEVKGQSARQKEEWQVHKREGLIDGEVASEDSQTLSDSQTLFSTVDSQCL